MSVRQDEVGKILLINAKFNMSGNTELKVVFKNPDQTVLEKTSADGVTAPAVDVTVEIDGVEQTFLANQYWQYITITGDLDQAGSWTFHGEYSDGTPKDFSGDVSPMPVLPRE